MFKLVFLQILCWSAISADVRQNDTTTLQSRITALSDKAKAGNLTKKEAKEFRDIGFQVQNAGFRLDEKSHDYTNSLTQINKALDIWILTSDTLNEANNRKFKGYLLGRLGKYSEEKKEIVLSISLFEQKGKAAGVAVCYFDLSRLFEFQKSYDSSLYYANLALTYWKSNADSMRIFIVQNQLINIYTHTKKYKEAESFAKLNFFASQQSNFHWQQKIDLYYVTAELYKKWKKKFQANRYSKLLENKISSLASEGTVASSTFESH